MRELNSEIVAAIAAQIRSRSALTWWRAKRPARDRGLNAAAHTDDSQASAPSRYRSTRARRRCRLGCSDLSGGCSAKTLARRSHLFTEMIFADRFIADAAYRERKFQTLPADRPLILQLAGNDPDTLAAAVKLAATLGVDGVDLNVGCPLPQARDSCFGAYLLDREKWPLLERCVAAMRAAAEPAGLVCSCKIRLLETAEATAELARRLEAAGADFISVHGRPRPAAERHRTHRQEAADLDVIGVVAAAVSIVVANGNTEYPADVAANVATTGCAGVMAGEGLCATRSSSLRRRARVPTARRAARCSPRRSSTLISPSATRPRACPSSAATCSGGSAGAARRTARRLRTAARTHRRNWAWRSRTRRRPRNFERF